MGRRILKAWTIGVAITLVGLALALSRYTFYLAVIVNLPFQDALAIFGDIFDKLQLNPVGPVRLWAPPLLAGLSSSVFYGVLVLLWRSARWR